MGLTIGFVAAIFFSSLAWADDPKALLSKEDAAQMFAMSETQWVANVETIKASQLGDYQIAPTGEYTLYMRPDTSAGLLAVSPSYASDKSRPWKLSVSVNANTPNASSLYTAMTEEDVEHILQTAMRNLAPEFPVMGYMVRNKSQPPAIHFSIFQRNDFPEIGMINESGQVCPTQGGEKTCVRTSMIK